MSILDVLTSNATLIHPKLEKLTENIKTNNDRLD